MKNKNSITAISRKMPAVLLLFVMIAAAFSLGCIGSKDGATDGDTLYIYYTGTLEDGTVFDSNVGGQVFPVVLGQHTVVPGFENALYGMKVNETKTVKLQPEEAYPYDPANVVAFDKTEVVESLGHIPAVGDEIWQSNGIQSFRGIILEITDEFIVIDFNLDVAGKVLIFEITISDIQKGNL